MRESTTDLNTRLIRGRIPRAVAILWNAKYENIISELRLGVYWAIGIELKYDDKRFVIVSIYTPYESYANETEYLFRLAHIYSCIEELDTSCVYIVGDLNADVSDVNSLFTGHLHNFCGDNDLVLSSEAVLPRSSFTYISDAHHTVSWLDHCISTADAHESIQNIEVFYNLATTDHIPVCITLDLNNIPILTNQTNNCTKHYIDWSGMQQQDLSLRYSALFLPQNLS